MRTRFGVENVRCRRENGVASAVRRRDARPAVEANPFSAVSNGGPNLDGGVRLTAATLAFFPAVAPRSRPRHWRCRPQSADLLASGQIGAGRRSIPKSPE